MDWTGLSFTASFSHKDPFPVRFDRFKEVRAVMLQLIVADTVDVHHVLFALRHLFGKFPEGRVCKDILFRHPVFICKPFPCTGKFAKQEFIDRKSTRLNSSHVAISYAIFYLKKIINYIIIITYLMTN